MTDNYECYPVTTFSDYDQITKQLGIPLDFKSQNSERMMKTRAQIGDKKQISPCGLKAALYDKIGTLTLKYDDSTKEIVLDTTDLVHDMYKKHAVSDPEDYIDVTDPKFLSWYFPQVPGFGTKLFLGTATQGLSGKVRFLFDKRGVFFEPTQTPEIILIVRGSKLSETFSNQTFGWINIGVGVFSIFGFWLFTYLQSKKAQI